MRESDTDTQWWWTKQRFPEFSVTLTLQKKHEGFWAQAKRHFK